MSDHNRHDADAHGRPGEHQATYDREINAKAIGKWMLGLLVVVVVCQVLSLWFLRGLRGFDERNDPKLLPIQQEMKVNDQLPPEPRLQVTPAFEQHNKDAISRSDVEDMQILHKQEAETLGKSSWIDQGQGRVRVPIDVAMEVIASRGAAAAAAAPPAADGQLPAATESTATESTGPAVTAPGAPAPAAQPAPPPAAQEQ